MTKIKNNSIDAYWQTNSYYPLRSKAGHCQNVFFMNITDSQIQQTLLFIKIIIILLIL